MAQLTGLNGDIWLSLEILGITGSVHGTPILVRMTVTMRTSRAEVLERNLVATDSDLRDICDSILQFSYVYDKRSRVVCENLDGDFAFEVNTTLPSGVVLEPGIGSVGIWLGTEETLLERYHFLASVMDLRGFAATLLDELRHVTPFGSPSRPSAT